MKLTRKVFILLLTLLGVVGVKAQSTVTVSTQITDESSLVEGTPYVLQYTPSSAYIQDVGDHYDVPYAGNSSDLTNVYRLIKDGDNWKIQNLYTGKWWPAGASQTVMVPTDAESAGSWVLNLTNGVATPKGNGYGLDRLTPKLVSWNTTSSNTIKIYEATLPEASTTPLNELIGFDVSVSSEAATSLSAGKWYVMFDRGAYHGYLYENASSHTLYNTNTVPSGSTASAAKYLVRLMDAGNGKYYLQTGLGNFFGNITQSTAVPVTPIISEAITIEKIANTDGHFYLQSAAGVVLDANNTYYGDATVVGYGTTVPTSTGGNNDWAFYPVELVESWTPTASEVYTINNTNTSRGALIYNPDVSTEYVWSSGKSGTFNSSDANSQWVIYPTETEGQFYLYNVGANKFAIPTGITQSASNSWVFSDNAVAVIFEKQDDGTRKIKMATNPVNGTNAAYMAVSNNYTGPIINYNDVGGNFTITKVEGADASTAAHAAIAKLVKNQTVLTNYPQASGWYVIQIKSKTGSASYANRYVKSSPILYNGLYPLTFTGAIDEQPSITDATFFTHLECNDWDNNIWQLPDGRYLVDSNNKFPTVSSTPSAIIAGYEGGNYFKTSNNWFADPYNSDANYFIGETSSFRTVWNVYPINLATAGLTAWQMICDNAPETQEITCSRTDVSGLTSVYKNGYFFLPSNVTPLSSDFTLEGATSVTIDATAHTATFAYNPNLAIVEGGVAVAQGWQTAGRDGEVMLLKVTADPFKAATNVTMSVNLKDGSEANISALTLYEASSSSPEIYSTGSGAPTKTVIASANISGSTATFNIGNLSAGTHYYWIGATVSSTATLGAIIDAAVTGITYTCNDNVTNLDLTAVGDPADRGAMIFNAHSYPFLPRDNGSRVYRIPAMIVADDGSIVVAADKRYESHTDIGGGHVIDIVVRRSTDGGKTWSDPVTIAKGLGTADDDKCGYGDPSLVKGKDGKLYCLFVAGNLGYFYGQKHVAMSTSTDNGVTWSSNETTPPIDLFSENRIQNWNTVGEAGYGLYDYFVTSGRGLYIPDDDILMYLIPAQTMTSATEHTSNSQDYIFYSTDGGAKWYFSPQTMFAGGDEAKIIQMNDGSLLGSIRQAYNRGFNTATYTKNNDGTLTFTMGSQWNNSQLSAGGYANNQDIFYYQRETVTGKTDVIIHSMTTGQHANLKLYYSTDQGANWTEFLNVQTKGARYVTMERSGTEENPGSLYLFYEDQSLNSAGGYTDYNHYPLNFLEITREQLKKYITTLDDHANVNPVEGVKVVYGMTGHTTYGILNGLTWTSKETSGVITGDNTIAGLTMVASDGAFNQFSNWNSHFNMAYHPVANNTPATLTLTAPAGYVIEGYSMLLARASSNEHTYTVSSASGTTIDVPFGSSASAYATLEQTDINATSTTITVTTSDIGKWLAIADFVVNLKRAVEYKVVDGNGNEWASQIVVFDTNSAVDEMPMSLKRAFCTYTYYSDAACTTPVTQIDDLATIYVKCEFDGPFEFSTTDNPKWYLLHSQEQNSVDANDYFANADGTTWQTTSQTDEKTLYSNKSYHWTFFGNPYALRLVNRESGKPLSASANSGSNGSNIPLSVTDAETYPYHEFTVYGYAGVLDESEGVVDPFVLILKDSYYGFLIYNGTMKYYSSGVSITDQLGLKGWRSSDLMVIEVPQTVEVTISAMATDGEFNYGTLYYGNMNLMLPEGVTAYTAAVSDGNLTLSEVTGAIPAGTGVVLKTDSKLTSNTTFSFIEDTEGGTVVAGNMLLGTDDAAITTAPEGSTGTYKFYALSLNGSNAENTVGFYYRKGCPNGEAFQNGAHKAYLAVPIEQASGAKGFAFSDTVTSIEIPTSETSPKGENIYNLSGQRVSTLSKGIYIVNGKKVVVK